MPETYDLTNTASDLSVPGSNFDNEVSRAAGVADTQSVTVANGTTETDYGFTPAGDPSTDGGSGSRTWTANVDIAMGNNDLQLAVNIHRINSTGTVQSSGTLSGEQQATAGVKTFTFSATDLGTWASGDRFRVDLQLRDTSAHGNENLTYNTEAGGTNVVAPWTIAAAGRRRTLAFIF